MNRVVLTNKVNEYNRSMQIYRHRMMGIRTQENERKINEKISTHDSFISCYCCYSKSWETALFCLYYNFISCVLSIQVINNDVTYEFNRFFCMYNVYFIQLFIYFASIFNFCFCFSGIQFDILCRLKNIPYIGYTVYVNYKWMQFIDLTILFFLFLCAGNWFA